MSCTRCHKLELELVALRTELKWRKKQFRVLKKLLDKRITLFSDSEDEDEKDEKDEEEEDKKDDEENDNSPSPDQLDELIRTVSVSKPYSATLRTLCNNRSLLLGTSLDLNSYIELLGKHKTILGKIFHRFEHKKKISTIGNAFSPLDLRLLSYSGYHNTSISLDEVNRFRRALENTDQKYTPFNMEQLCNRICTRLFAFFPFVDCLKILLLNRNGYNNLVYIPLEKSLLTDPYSFYSLEKVEKGNRYWHLECRLEEICGNLFEFIRNHCVSLFRKIYRDVFGDNELRDDYFSYCPVLSEDCDQLIRTLKELICPSSFRKRVQTLIIEHSSINPTGVDICNLTSDDSLQRKQLKSEKVEIYENPTDVLFDNKIQS